MTHPYHPSAVGYMLWRGIMISDNELERLWKEAVLAHFKLLFCGIRELEKPVGAADYQDSILLQHSTAAFRDGIYIWNGSKRSPGVCFIRHRPHAKPEHRRRDSIVFMANMKLMHAFRNCSNVLKHLVTGGSANCFDVESVHPATTCVNKALKSPPPRSRNT
jgi:hypothetical protein